MFRVQICLKKEDAGTFSILSLLEMPPFKNF